MNISLPSNLEAYVKNLVKSGDYAGYSDVIQDALRLHKASRSAYEIVMTAELEKLLDDGMEDLDQAKTTSELRREK